MTVYQSRFQRAFERRQSLPEMVVNGMILLIVCLLTAALLSEIPRAIDTEVQLSAISPPFLSQDQKTDLMHKMMVNEFAALREIEAVRR